MTHSSSSDDEAPEVFTNVTAKNIQKEKQIQLNQIKSQKKKEIKEKRRKLNELLTQQAEAKRLKLVKNMEMIPNDLIQENEQEVESIQEQIQKAQNQHIYLDKKKKKVAKFQKDIGNSIRVVSLARKSDAKISESVLSFLKHRPSNVKRVNVLNNLSRNKRIMGPAPIFN